ncbi:hypothetical protein [Phytomonospora endophytica]|uniref:Uncharacterized protein n=1 Tax=Phytomonospora endophytica TaxID=714109 RepID=A0A841FRJ0_9ACTN|nr:hypothetical protein [Phytomonospora endophytica]MBB6035917.1 hypothetical protein [Phytomonospora endophytica]GIG71086.1 hypothetical protein Pen01_73810 [Phytomonospora endophytica]
MIYALGQPAALAGLVAALALGLGIRHVTQALAARGPGRATATTVLPHWRRDLDPIGLIAAVLGGTGWGATAPTTGLPRPRAIWTALSGPAATLTAGIVVLAAYGAAYPGSITGAVYRPSDVLRGVPGPAPEQLLFTAGVGLLCFAVVALIPLPPTDGWALTRGERGGAVAEFLEGRRVGALIMLFALVLPIGGVPPLHRVLDLVLTPVVESLT